MKNFYKSNAFLAIVSVICAVIIWIYVVYEVNPLYETWIDDVPVQCVNVSSQFEDGDLVFVGENSKLLKEGLTVDVKIKGKRYDVSSVSKKDITCTVDTITITKKGNYTLPIDVQTTKSGVEILKVSPISIELSAESILQKDIKITVVQKGELPQGYMIENIRPANETVTITGPGSVIEKVDTAKVVLDMTNIDLDGNDSVAPIEFYDERGNKVESDSIQKNNKQAKITFDLYTEKEVTVKVVPKYKNDETKNNHGQNVQLTVNGDEFKDGGLEIKVKLKGEVSLLNRYTDSVREVYTEDIDVSNIYSDKIIEKKLNSKLPNDVEYVEVPTVKISAYVAKASAELQKNNREQEDDKNEFKA